MPSKEPKKTNTPKKPKPERTVKQAQERAKKVFHAFIRERDKDLPCISCGTDRAAVYHAGHYLSSGNHPAHRFNPYNVHKQCQKCNYFLSGNLLKYRVGLIKKIGLKLVELLEASDPRFKFTVDELDQIHDAYKTKLVELKK